MSASVLIPVALGCTWIGGAAFSVMVGAISIGMAYEWAAMCGDSRSPAAIVLYAALPLSVAVTAADSAAHALLLLAVATVVATVLRGGLSLARPLAFGIAWLGPAAVALVWLRQAPVGGGANVIVLLLIIWASDIGAYIAGRAIGGPRLAPSVSPGKTWSGAVGGLIAAGCVGFAASPGNELCTAGIAILIGVIAQAGDLFESRVKRHFGVKDSGNLIPGHGGLLDRIDAVLTAAPAAALLALLLGRGVVLWE